MNRPTVAMLTALASCVVACHCGTTNNDTPAASPEVSIAAPPATPPVNLVYDAYDGPLVASNSTGVFLLDPQGAIQATISDEGGHNPRWLRPGESLLVLRSNQPVGGQRTLALVEIDIAAGSERVIVDDLIGDTIKCPPGSVNEYGEELDQQLRDDLDVQDDWHFRVSAERGLACAWLMDSNFNMHTLAVEAKVNLADGTVVRRQLRPYHCEPAPKPADDDRDCTAMSLTVQDQQASDAELAAIGPYHVRDGALWRRSGASEELIAGPFGEQLDPGTEEPGGLATFDPVSRSPTGRWAVLWGNEHWGDYLHMSWLLLDTQTGELFAISGPTWPAPLSRDALSRLDYPTVDNDVTPETNRVWLSDDRLVIGRWLIVPGKSVTELPGELAR